MDLSEGNQCKIATCLDGGRRVKLRHGEEQGLWSPKSHVLFVLFVSISREKAEGKASAAFGA